MKRSFALLLFLVLAVPAWGQDYKKGANAASRGDYVEALKWYRKAAEQGSVEAHYQLGILYYNGRGVTKDVARGIKWHRRAAENGHSVSQFILGSAYFFGKDVPQNSIEAMKWYRRAAEQGDASGQFALGGMYSHDSSVPQELRFPAAWPSISVASSRSTALMVA